MLTRIRNANLVKHEIVDVPFTNFTQRISNILVKEQFIKDAQNMNGFETLRLYLRYDGEIRNP
jgi:small subunit ribosomal protein S8